MIAHKVDAGSVFAHSLCCSLRRKGELLQQESVLEMIKTNIDVLVKKVRLFFGHNLYTARQGWSEQHGQRHVRLDAARTLHATCARRPGR